MGISSKVFVSKSIKYLKDVNKKTCKWCSDQGGSIDQSEESGQKVTSETSYCFLVYLIVSTGSIRWILWFTVRYAPAAAARREIFGVNALRGKQQQLGSPNLQDIFIGG